MLKIQFKPSAGANPMVEYQYYDGLVPSGILQAKINQSVSVQIDPINGNIAIGGLDLNTTQWHFSNILDAGGAPFGSALLAYNYLVGLFAQYATGSGGAGGGGGTADSTAANQVTQIGLATTANSSLATIAATMLLQREFSETIWVDSIGTFYIRTVTYNEGTGSYTTTNTLPNGTPYIPTAPSAPASVSADIELVKSVYRAIAAGVGYSIGDIVTQIKIIQTVFPFAVIGTVYFNNNTSAQITPIFADLEVYSTPSQDVEFIETKYIVIAAGTGYSKEDYITQVKVMQAYSPFGEITTLYYNNTTGLFVTPAFADLEVFLNQDIVNRLLAIENNQIAIQNSQKTVKDYIATVTTGLANVGDVLRKTSVLNTLQITLAPTETITWFNVTQNTALLGVPNEGEYIEIISANAVKSREDYIALSNGVDFLKNDILRRYETSLINQITGAETSLIEWRNITQGASLLSSLPSEDEYAAYVKTNTNATLANQKLMLGGWDTDLSQGFNEIRTYDPAGVYTSVFETFDGATWAVYTPTSGALVYSDISIYGGYANQVNILARLTEIKAIQTDGTQKTGIWQGVNQLVINADGSIKTTETVAINTLVSSIVVVSGNVASGAVSVSFVTSSDFSGTINGVVRQADTSYTFDCPKVNTFNPIPYTITSGSILIDRIL